MNNQAEHGGVFDWKAHFWVPFDDQDNNEAIELDLWTSYKFSNSAGVACNIKTFDDSSFPTVQELNDWPHPYYTGVGSNHPYVDNESSYMTGQQWKMSAGLDPYITSFAGDVCINWYDDE
jgi:hypothetical protein